MFQDNLIACRKAKGMTQEELAVRLHVVRQTVSKWEKASLYLTPRSLSSCRKCWRFPSTACWTPPLPQRLPLTKSRSS